MQPVRIIYYNRYDKKIKTSVFFSLFEATKDWASLSVLSEDMATIADGYAHLMQGPTLLSKTLLKELPVILSDPYRI